MAEKRLTKHAQCGEDKELYERQFGMEFWCCDYCATTGTTRMDVKESRLSSSESRVSAGVGECLGGMSPLQMRT